MWRPEDEALLSRLEDELVFERFWRDRAGNAPLPPLRAAGMISLLRRTAEGRAAIEAALGGSCVALGGVTFLRRADTRPPELHHHLALFEAKVADAVVESQPGAAMGANGRAIAAWIALGEEKQYLRTLGEAVAGTGLPKAELDRVLAEAPFTRIDALGQQARKGAGERTLRAHVALRSLGQLEDQYDDASSTALEKAALARARRHRMAAIDDALAPIDEALAAAADRGEALTAAPAIFGEIKKVWDWADKDEAVERFAVERASSIAWDAYRLPGWDALRKVITPLQPMIDGLAARIEADPTRIAYAASCAQLVVFTADIEPSLDGEMKILERALRVCPSHRNTRARIAGRLCESAIKLADASGRLPKSADLEQAEAQLRRAEELFPSAEKLPDARKKITESRRLFGRVT